MSGATSRAPGSPKEEKADLKGAETKAGAAAKKDEKEEESDDDWE